MEPSAPRGGWFGFPGFWGNVQATFLFYPIAAILPKGLQAPPVRAKMGAVQAVVYKTVPPQKITPATESSESDAEPDTHAARGAVVSGRQHRCYRR